MSRLAIAPVVILLIGYQLPLLLEGLGVPLLITFCLTITATLFASFGLPPTLESWDLTGQHRIFVVNVQTSSTSEIQRNNEQFSPAQF